MGRHSKVSRRGYCIDREECPGSCTIKILPGRRAFRRKCLLSNGKGMGHPFAISGGLGWALSYRIPVQLSGLRLWL